MRVFVAVFPPPETREALAEAARSLPVSGVVRLIPASNVHLTLKFLGEMAETDLDRVAQALEPLRTRHKPFEANFSGFGAFPSPKRARILWAGIGEGADGLIALAQEVEDFLKPLGFEREGRPYLPHLTLGRARRGQVILEKTEAKPSVPGFRVRRLELVQSVLGIEGATYSTLAAYPLSESRD